MKRVTASGLRAIDWRGAGRPVRSREIQLASSAENPGVSRCHVGRAKWSGASRGRGAR
jgi:hypothetical protein